MDAITTAIVTALSAGAVAGITDTAKTAINDSYNKLKGLLTKKHGKGSDVVQAVEKLEAKPESQGRKETLAEEIAAVRAEQDEEIVAAAKQVLILAQPQQANMGKYSIQHEGPVQGLIIGDYQHITQYFSNPLREKAPEELPLSSDVVLIDASLDPSESPYEETVKEGKKKIIYKGYKID
jgi:hypothetical protein